jgi:hypothetical protein
MEFRGGEIMGNVTVAAAIKEDTLKSASRERKGLLALIAFLAILPFMAPEPTPAAPAKPAAAAPAPFNRPLAKIWHSQSTQHDFRVQASNDLFRADWVNIPPAAAKQGASIHTECRKSGPKWVGTSNINMLCAIPGAPPGKDTKMCSFTVRFEVDSVTSLKITGHSESLKSFDVKTCRVQKTDWTAFTWVPKK